MSVDKKDLVNFRLGKAKEVLFEVDIQIENGLWNTAINRSYYACFHAVTALLAAYDINAKTHSGVRQMLGLHFVHTRLIDEAAGEFYSTLFYMRQSADYEDFLEYDEDDAIKLLQPSRDFVALIDTLLSKG